MKKVLLGIVFCLALLSLSAVAQESKKPIKIGHINAQTNGTYFTHPSGYGIKLAIEEINAKGGVLGRPLEVISRDSKMNPGEAVRLAEELVVRDKVDVLMASDASGPVVALASWVKRNHMPLVVATGDSDNAIWGEGSSDYVARINAGGYVKNKAIMQKLTQVYGDKIKNKRWVSVAPAIEFGRYYVKTIKQLAEQEGLKAKWVEEQWPAFGKMEAGSTIMALEHANPDIVYVILSGSDVVSFVREAKKRGFVKNRIFIFPYLSMPQHFELLGKEVPKGWISLGCPFDDLKKNKPALKAFMQRYEAAYHKPVSNFSLTGYNGIKAIAAVIEKAGSTDPEKIKDAFDDLRFDTPFGEQTIRKIDHQATAFLWVGLSDFIDGYPGIRQWTEYNVNDTSPPDSYVLKLRGRK
ncbi:MAG TPA: hypothetical protein DD400_03430 [Rhodospirillaceae bacterium]|nr:hypothetical protein [Rhodospirillaceae bacterium]